MEQFEKQCTKCLKVKAFSEFRKIKNRKSGIASKCKECYSEYEKHYRLINKKHYSDYYKIWASLNRPPSGKVTHRAPNGKFTKTPIILTA